MSIPRMLKIIWAVCIIIMAACLLMVSFYKEFTPQIQLMDYWVLFIILSAISFFAEYIDSSMGMGYGTILTPVLIIAGYSPLKVVPAILFSEFVSGISAGLLHHRLGNVDLGRKTRARKIMLALLSCSILGTLGAVVLAVSLPQRIVKLYIGVMILSMGILILLGRFFSSRFSWRKIVALGTLAAFNKGFSGGGYGPLVTGGQILSGVPEKNAIGITSLTEGIVCLVGVILYQFAGGALDWMLAVSLTVGAFLSTPVATLTVKVLHGQTLRHAIGYTTLFLGALTLIKLL
ncbi:MAG TPA: sulfite exporter TauE/SafE family protein [archaeon]|nr:sulfite exporter TauE/SafE family protein [archaeon]